MKSLRKLAPKIKRLPERMFPRAALAVLGLLSLASTVQANPAYTETTPSKSEYFTWINDTWEGSTENQSVANLNFFKWLHDQYGMNLDIYALDAGNVDTQTFFGAYGSLTSSRFQSAFPNSFTPMVTLAGSFDCKLGLWMGPDGFGSTSGETTARTNFLTTLVSTYNMGLFKIDAEGGSLVAGNDVKLRDALASAITLQPALIVLDHRAPLGAAQVNATTTLWQGDETYIDVKMSNNATAPHHRQGAMGRGMTPSLTRLVEDHGVCLSSCMDAWDDDLILSAFGRSLILAPEIYGNPWLLKDGEFSKLARIYNLHQRYGAILVNGKSLPSTYGPSAVARGDGNTRFVVMKNLTWAPVTYSVQLNSEIGLTGSGTYQVRQLHPTEKIIGSYAGGSIVPITVDPFRSSLIMVSNTSIAEVGIAGANYAVQQDKAGQPVVVKVLGQPGTSATITLQPGSSSFSAATLNGAAANQLVSGGSASVTFPGTALTQPITRSLGTLASISVPGDAETLYEATCFAADNNSLEARSLARAGNTAFTQVQTARTAFFDAVRPGNYSNGIGAPVISDYGMWDKYAFDNDNNTSFTTQRAEPVNGGGFRIDFGGVVTMTQLRFYNVQDSLPNLNAQVSSNLSTWTTIPMTRSGSDLIMNVSGTTFRYFRIAGRINRVTEIRAFNNAAELSRTNWRATNLFGAYSAKPATSAWSISFTLPEAPVGSYFCVGLEGDHGLEGAYAAARIDGQPVGAPDRATSYPTGMWESGPVKSGSNYTYYIPIKASDAGKTVDLVVLGLQGGTTTFTPKAWITAPTPYTQSVDLVLTRTGGSTPASYALTVNSGTGGGSYIAGSIVNVAANTPSAGQVFAGWTGNTSALANSSASITTLTMPAAATVITATYTSSNPTTYALTVNNGSGGGSYAAGNVVSVSANTPPAGQVFAGWTGATSALANPASATTTLTMPSAATSISATYTSASTYALTVNSGTGSGNYTAGSVVNVSANTPPAGQVFSAWTGNTAGLASATSASTTLTMPAAAAAITATYVAGGGVDKIRFYPRSGFANRMTGGVFEGTNGDPVTGTYTVIHSISAQPVADVWTEVNTSLGTYRYLRYRGPNSSFGNVSEIEFYRSGTKLTGTGYGTAGSYGSGGDTFAKALDGNTATFFDSSEPHGAYVGVDTGVSGPVTYALTVNSGTGGGSYAAGTVVSVSANAAPAGQVFSGWTGSTSALASTTSASTTLTMPAAAASITANYVATGGVDKLRYYPRAGFAGRMVGGIFEGTNGDPDTGTYSLIHTITVQPPEAWTEVNAGLGSYRYLRYRAPTSGFGNVAEVEFYRGGVKLSGTPFGTPGSFQNLGDTFVKVYDGNTSTYFDSTQPNGAYAGIDTGTSTPATYALTVNSGTGGGTYAAGTAITVTANTPPAGQVFSAWTGNTAGLASITSPSTTLTMPSSAASITATYVNSSGGSLPSPWTSSDIGSPLAGGGTYSSGIYTVQGSGADIWDSSDSFRYVYRTMTGDGTIVAKVESVGNTNAWAKAGVMLRSSLGSGASNAYLATTPGGSMTFQRRLTDGTATINTVLGSLPAPVWVKITRSGNSLTAAYSSNGTSWTTISSETITMSSTVYIGLAVTSHASGSVCTATFSNVSP